MSIRQKYGENNLFYFSFSYFIIYYFILVILFDLIEWESGNNVLAYKIISILEICAFIE